jgi:hypothetical protein
MKTIQLMARVVLTGALILAATAPAQAGRNCEAQAPSARSVQRGMNLATRTARALDASGATVVVLARAGQDLSKYRLRWSHLGFAYKVPGSATIGLAAGAASSGVSAPASASTSASTSASVPASASASASASSAPPSVWRVVHKLNQCGSASAEVYRQGLAEFFLDDPFEYVAAFAVLTPEVQAKLLPVLQDNAQLSRLHQPAYSMVAYPWAQTYQQSNQWAIETLAMAVEPSATTRERAQSWLRFKAYEPTTLRLNAMVRLGARMAAGNVAFDDHPNDKRFSDRIETVTADSVFDWLQSSGLSWPMKEQR